MIITLLTVIVLMSIMIAFLAKRINTIVKDNDERVSELESARDGFISQLEEKTEDYGKSKLAAKTAL